MTDIVLRPRVRVKAGRSEGNALVVRAAEGQYRPGPYSLPISGGWLSADVGANLNWWQMGNDLETGGRSAMVEACVSAYAQTVAMCPGDHWHKDADGGRTRVTKSALARILKVPNSYQTISDLLLNIVRQLYSDGNAYVLVFRNNRFEITSMHLMQSAGSRAMVAETGEIFYSLSGNTVVEQMFDYPMMVPARDVMHIKLASRGWDPLRGESPICAAARDIAASDAMLSQQLAFYLNQARPSTVLQTDMVLDKDQVTALRDRWNEQVRGLNSGGTPILTAGLKPVPLSMNAVDSQLVEIMKMSEQHIALAFRVPMQILGIGGSGPVNYTLALMEGWLNQSLGFCLNHVEESFGKTFGLGGFPDDYLELDTDALLRSAQKDRIESMTRAVQGGIFSPDEARAKENMGKVPGGFGVEPRVQQQLVPLSAASAIPAAPPAPPAPAAPVAAVAPAKDFSDATVASLKRRFRSSHERQVPVDAA